MLLRLFGLILLGAGGGIMLLELSFRLNGTGGPVDNQSLMLQWLPKAPVEWTKSYDFHVWLAPGDGYIEYRTDLDGTLVHKATHHITSRRTRGQEVEEFPPSGQKRIIALGDSVTFGQGVNDHETFISQFDSLLSSHEVLNAAVPTWGLGQYYSFVQNIAEEYNPDEIMLFFFVNDFLDPDYYYDGEPLAPLKLPKAKWSSSEMGLRRYFYIYNHYRRIQEREALEDKALSGHNSYTQLIRSESQLKLGRRALTRIGEVCQTKGWRCTLVTLPLLEDASTKSVQSILDKAAEYALDANIRVIRMDNSLQKLHIYERWLFPSDQHMSARAHSVFAHTLAAAYKELYTDAR